MKSRRRLFRVAFVSVFAAIGLAAVSEGVLRGLERRDFERDARFVARRAFFKKLSWEFLPLAEVPGNKLRANAKVETKNEDGSPLIIKTNSRGFRTDEFEARPTAGRPRVLCLGGSTTFMGPTNETTYPALVAKALAPRSVEVLNLGISGASSAVTRRRFLEEYADYAPRVAVAYEGINDVTFLHLERTMRLQPSFRLARLRLLRPLLALRPEADRYRSLVRETTIANLEAIRAACEARSIKFVACTFAAPNLARLSPEERTFLDHDWQVFALQDGTTLADYRFMLDIVNDEIRGFAKAHALPLAALAEEFADDGIGPFEDCCHFNASGRERQARVVAQTIASLLDGS